MIPGSRPGLPWPARCSRDTAMVAVFRLASPTPNRNPFPWLSHLTARPFKGGRSEAGGGSWPQWPERAPLQGAKVTNRFSGESEPLMRRASESLNVRHLLITQRRTRCGAWCEERAGQPLAPEQRDKPGASSYQQKTTWNSEVM